MIMRAGHNSWGRGTEEAIWALADGAILRMGGSESDRKPHIGGWQWKEVSADLTLRFHRAQVESPIFKSMQKVHQGQSRS